MRLRLLTAALVIGSAGLGFVPIASAGTTATTMLPTDAGWFQPNPACSTPAGCVTTDTIPAPLPAEPPTSPFPARTLHVGIAGGVETARTYLAYPLLLMEGTLTSASLTVPLDVSPASGSITPETAKLQACPALGLITDVDGSIKEPPFIDCSASVPMAYVATPQPHLEGNLSGITSALTGATGIVLLPDATKSEPSDAWRVVLSAPNRTDTGKTAPPTLAVELTTEEPPSTGTAEPQEPASGPTFGAVAPPVGTGFAPTGPEMGPLVPTTPGPVTPTVPQASSPELITVGYAYPQVWLLPLVFLVLIPAIGRALTKDLTPGSAEA